MILGLLSEWWLELRWGQGRAFVWSEGQSEEKLVQGTQMRFSRFKKGNANQVTAVFWKY